MLGEGQTLANQMNLIPISQIGLQNSANNSMLNNVNITSQINQELFNK